MSDGTDRELLPESWFVEHAGQRMVLDVSKIAEEVIRRMQAEARVTELLRFNGEFVDRARQHHLDMRIARGIIEKQARRLLGQPALPQAVKSH